MSITENDGKMIAINLHKMKKVLLDWTSALKESLDCDSFSHKIEHHRCEFEVIASNIIADINHLRTPVPGRGWPLLFKAEQGVPTLSRRPEELIAGNQVIAEHKLCMQSLIGFLVAALQVLSQLELRIRNFGLDDSTIHDIKDTAFKRIWSATCTCCNWFTQWMPSDHPLLNDTAVLLPALDDWMDWMLSALQKSKTLQLLVELNDDPGIAPHNPLLSILSLALIQLRIVRTDPSPSAFTLQPDVPRYFVHKICSITCELNASKDPKSMDTSMRTFTVKLVKQLGDLIFLQQSTVGAVLKSELVGPAAIQVAKLAVVASSWCDTSIQHDICYSQSVLTAMFTSNIGVIQIDAQLQAGTSATLKHTAQQLVSDKQILGAAFRSFELHPEWAGMLNAFINSVLTTWDWKLPGEEQFACLPSMVRHCAFQMGRWMRQHKSTMAMQHAHHQNVSRLVDPYMGWIEVISVHEMLLLTQQFWFAVVSARPGERLSYCEPRHHLSDSK